MRLEFTSDFKLPYLSVGYVSGDMSKQKLQVDQPAMCDRYLLSMLT